MRKLSIGFHPNVKRKDKCTKKTQVVMRVLVDGHKKEVRLPDDYDLSEKEVEKWNPIIQRLEIKDSDVNDYLNGIIARRKLIDLENLSNETNLTITEIEDKLMGYNEAVKEITAYEYAKKYLREEVENKKITSPTSSFIKCIFSPNNERLASTSVKIPFSVLLKVKRPFGLEINIVMKIAL